MQEILESPHWAIDERYFNRYQNALLAMLTTGQVNADLVAKRKAERPVMEIAILGNQTIAYKTAALFTAAAGNDKAGNPTATAVAVVPLQGPMTKYGGLCSYGTKDVVGWMNQANADPEIVAIVLKVDSPGGAVDGTEELANTIKNSAKPVVAFIDGLGASAAYWASSQAAHIIINSETTGWAGSIGTLIAHVDRSEQLAKDGVKYTFVTADRSTHKVLGNGTEPLSEEALAMFKADLNAINDTFISAVQAGRGDKLSTKEDPFTAKVYNGRDAKKIGLVDGIGTMSDAVKKAASLAKSNPTNNSNSKSNSMFSLKNSPRLVSALVAMGLMASAEADAPEADAALKGAEDALKASDVKIADLTAQLEKANTAKSGLEEQLKKANANLQEKTDLVATLEAWKKEQAGVQAPKTDETTRNDGGTSKSAFELAAEAEIAKAKSRK